MLRRLGPAALVLVVAAAGHAPAARAAAVGLSSDGATLIYRAAPGEANRLQITFFQDFTNPTMWVVQDAGASITAYAGCAVDPRAPSCRARPRVRSTSPRWTSTSVTSATRRASTTTGPSPGRASPGGPGNDDLLGVAHARNTSSARTATTA